MISATNKFPLRASFLNFKKKANKIPIDNFLIYFLPHTPSRLGVVVPKKVNKLATSRNWLKRITFDTLWPLIKDQNLDIVVVYKPLPLTKSLEAQKFIIKELNHSLNIKN